MKKERIAEIEEFIEEKNSVKISELLDHFNISMSTLRRDLEKLASEDKIIKTYGYVRSTKTNSRQTLLHSHNVLNVSEKKKTALLAAGLIENHDIIFIDSGSTCGLLVDFIPADYHVTIVTNNLDVIIRSMNLQNLDIYSLPGRLNRQNNSFSYLLETSPYEGYNIGKIFMSCAGIDIRYGISHAEINERMIKKTALGHTNYRIMLADSTKFGNVAPLHFCEISDFQTICTDKQPDEAYIKYCREHNVRLVY